VFDWLRTSDSMVAGYSGYGRPGPAPGLGVRTSFSAITVQRFREHTATLSDVFAFSPTGTLNIVADRQADTASGLFVTGSYFAGLGVRALVGRTLSASDDRPQAESVAVISHRYWRRRFASDPSLVGKTIDVNRSPVVIVGVMPEGFDGPRMSESSDITLPIPMAARLNPTGRARPVSVWWLQMMGRLKPGVMREQVLAELQTTFADTVRESWAARPPDTPNPTRSGLPQLRVRPGAQGADGPRIDALQILSAVFAVVAAILLIVCVNLATLLLVRASDTRREPLASGSAVDDRNPAPRHIRGDRRRHPRLVGERLHAVAPSTEDSHRGCAHRSAGARIHGCSVGDHRGAVVYSER